MTHKQWLLLRRHGYSGISADFSNAPGRRTAGSDRVRLQGAIPADPDYWRLVLLLKKPT